MSVRVFILLCQSSKFVAPPSLSLFLPSSAYSLSAGTPVAGLTSLVLLDCAWDIALTVACQPAVSGQPTVLAFQGATATVYRCKRGDEEFASWHQDGRSCSHHVSYCRYYGD